IIVRGQRDFRPDRAAAAGFTLEEERAAELANALAHADEADASGVAGAAGDEPDAVVGDDQANDASARASRTRTCVAFACFATLPSASCARRWSPSAVPGDSSFTPGSASQATGTPRLLLNSPQYVESAFDKPASCSTAGCSSCES